MLHQIPYNLLSTAVAMTLQQLTLSLYHNIIIAINIFSNNK